MNSGNIKIDNRYLLNEILYSGEQQQQEQQSLLYDNRKMYVESPTFAKDEEDMYRYVQSRLSNDNLSRPIQIRDTFELNNNDLSLKNRFGNSLDPNNYNYQFSNNNNNNKSNNDNLNTLMSDLAIASLNNSATNDARQNFRTRGRKPTIDDILFEKELIDSLETQPIAASSLPLRTTFVSAPVQSSTFNTIGPLDFQQQQLFYQPQQLTRQIQSNTAGYQFLPLPQPAPPVNPLFQPIQQQQQIYPQQQQQIYPQQQQQIYQQQQQQNMFYQQPLLLNSSYPLNLPNTNYYSNDYQNDANAYDAQPIPQPRKLNQNQYQQHIIQQKANLASQQSNRSFDSSVKQLNSPTSFDGDNEELGKDDSVLIRAYESQKKDKVSSSSQPQQHQLQQQQVHSSNKHEDDLKRQQIWDKLQRANKDIRTKNSSQVNTARKPPTGQNNTGRKRNAPGSFLPPEQLGSNFIESNVNAIKNKENLIHRYPLKTYEVMHKKMEQLKTGRSQSDTIIKKPPHHVQPIPSNDTLNKSANDFNVPNISVKPKFHSNSAVEPGTGLDAVKTISIPLDSSIWKDSERVNLDINLRLVDLLNQQELQNLNFSNHSLEDFNYHNNNGDPLDSHIKKLEKMSRSLPGSTGSFNRQRALPPLNRFDYKNDEVKLQHEIDYDKQDNEGYLATLYKNNQKPNIKTYTLKDYRQFKKDSGIPSTTSTGKLGFDFDSALYKEKIEQIQKKLDYAQRVRARNKRVLSEQTQNKREPLVPTYQQQELEKSNYERAREYFEKNIRQKFYTNDETDQKPTPPKRSSSTSKMQIKVEIQTKSKIRKNNSDSNFRIPKPQSQPIDNSKRTPSEIVRVRDPITSKVKAIPAVNDSKLDELAKRHQEEKNRVNVLLNHQKRESPLPDQEHEPQMIHEEPLLIESNRVIDTTGNLIEQKPKIHHYNDNSDENFQKLLERHKQEKQNVNQFKPVEVPDTLNSVEIKANGLPLSFETTDQQEFYEDIEV